jgi:hypothetical protein
MTWHSGMVTSARGEAVPRRGKGGDDAGWAHVNLIGPKMKKNHTIDLAAVNGR